MRRPWSILLLCLLPALPAAAADRAPQPQVTTQHDQGRTIREYRIDHQLYALEIISDGKTLILIDHDGDGNFQRTDTREGPPPIPPWVIGKK
ncbi:hypothetical protein BH688_15530 [Kushneria phosphatilytica]|nr:hypothetical protein BH688_15530 [Kushneria phosphatilytica]